MSYSSYVENGAIFWAVYVNGRSSVNPKVRVQRKRRGIQCEAEAKKLNKKLFKDVEREIARVENQGATWSQVIDRWEITQHDFPNGKYVYETIVDHASMLRKWTKPWLEMTAVDLNRGDGREILNYAESEGMSVSFVKKLKNTINVIYKWGLEERLIVGKDADSSPVRGLMLNKKQEEKLPEILTENEILELLKISFRQQHKWYSIWAIALHTGARNGELQGIRHSDLDLVSMEEAKSLDSKADHIPKSYGLIYIHRQWKTRQSAYGSTKSSYWRSVPVNQELYYFLKDLMLQDFGKDEHGRLLLPCIRDWRRGNQAKVLRDFCDAFNLKSVKFHTLRACWATKLVRDGVPTSQVMTMGGWKDLKTMMIYIRRAGIDVKGATSSVRILPNTEVLKNPSIAGNILAFNR